VRRALASHYRQLPRFDDVVGARTSILGRLPGDPKRITSPPESEKNFFLSFKLIE